MSKSEQQKAKEAFDSFQRLRTYQVTGTGIDLELAKELYYLKKDNRYRMILGYDKADKPTWKSFLAQPDVQISVPKAVRLLKIYETYIITYKIKVEEIAGIDSNSLQRLATVVNGNTVRSWINKAKNLSRADLYRILEYGDVKETECRHSWEKKTIKSCAICGTKRTIKV